MAQPEGRAVEVVYALTGAARRSSRCRWQRRHDRHGGGRGVGRCCAAAWRCGATLCASASSASGSTPEPARCGTGDRVEIYRPLRHDPRDARRELRAAGGRAVVGGPGLGRLSRRPGRRRLRRRCRVGVPRRRWVRRRGPARRVPAVAAPSSFVGFFGFGWSRRTRRAPARRASRRARPCRLRKTR